MQIHEAEYTAGLELLERLHGQHAGKQMVEELKIFAPISSR
jgi:hypothetical protein